MKPSATSDSLTKTEITRLGELRSHLLRLHKTLLELERQDFEKKSGRVDAGELLQLLINHPQFAWLRKISALIVEMDEMLTEAEPAERKDFEDLISQARSLLTAPEDKEFRTKYQSALQREPAAVLAHSAAMQTLPQKRN